MRISTTKPLFAWDCLEDSPSLRTVKQFLAAVPDAKLLSTMTQYAVDGKISTGLLN